MCDCKHVNRLANNCFKYLANNLLSVLALCNSMNNRTNLFILFNFMLTIVIVYNNEGILIKQMYIYLGF